MKRAFAILLVSILLFTQFPLPVLGETLRDSDYQYTLDAGSNASITRYVGSGGDVTVPDTLDGHPVTRIGDGAFYGCTSLTSLTLPAGITNIGEGTFSGCTRLASLTLPVGVTSIGESAFFDCYSLTSLTLPAGVTHIGKSAFFGCKRLSSLTLPDTVIYIGEGAFFICDSLISLIIPAGVKSIGKQMFWDCSSLTSVTLPAGATSIGEEAFWDCENLTSLTLPAGLTSIGEEAFYSCEGLTSLILPDCVKSIGKKAFSGCSSLAYITLPAGLASIDSSAFDFCSSLVMYVVPDSYAHRYALENGLKFFPNLKSAQASFQDYVQGKVSVEQLFILLGQCGDIVGEGYDRGMALLGQSEKAAEFGRLAALLNACETAEAKSPGLMDYLSKHSISEPAEGLDEAVCRLFRAVRSPALLDRVRLYEPKEQLNYTPVLWTQEAFEDFFGTERFVPSQPRPDTCLIMLEGDSKVKEYDHIALVCKNGGEYDLKAKEILSALLSGSGGKLKFTGNPHLASVWIYIRIDYPFAGEYWSGRNSFDGYNCTLSLRAQSVKSRKEIAKVIFRNDLPESIMIRSMPKIMAASLPVIYDSSSEVKAFLKKVLEH